MSLLNAVLGAAMGGGGQGGGGQGALLNMVVGMLTQGSQGGGAASGAGGLMAGLGAALGGGGAGGAGAAGGLAGLGQLVEQFQRGGLGDVVGSWISTGKNLPISAEQLGAVLGDERISGMASQLGINPNDLLGQLSTLLPEVVDKLTPEGQIPQQPDLGQLGSLLGGLMGQR